MSNIDTILRSFATQIRDAARAEILASLSAGKAAHPREAAARQTRASKKGGKRTADELDALQARLFSYISKHPGQRIEQIGSAMGVPTRELNLPVKKLIGTKRIMTKGQKRATTYSASGR